MTDTTQQAPSEAQVAADLNAVIAGAEAAPQPIEPSDASGDSDDDTRAEQPDYFGMLVDGFADHPGALQELLSRVDAIEAARAARNGVPAKPVLNIPPEPGAWLKDVPADDRDFIVAKGWKSPAELLRSYRNVERLVGDRLPRPRGDDDVAALERIYKALGRPDAPDGYRLPEVEGQDPAFSAEAAKWFHAAGLSRRQAAVLAESWNTYIAARGRDDGHGLSPQEARARIEALKQDKEWKARFLAGDRDEFTRWTRLHETAGAAHG